MTRERIIEINKVLQPYYLLITMLIFFIGTFVGVYKFFFKPSDVVVKIDVQRINYPSSINSQFLDVHSYIQDSTSNADIKTKSTHIYKYLIGTKEQKTIEIINNTNKTIRSVNIREPRVRDLIAWAVNSEYLLEEEKDKLLRNIVLEEESGVVYMKDAVNIPPNGNLKIYLWGDFNNISWDESLIVNYDGGTAEIEYTRSFSGFQAIIAEYFFLILLFLIITFIIVYYLLVNKYANNQKNSRVSN